MITNYKSRLGVGLGLVSVATVMLWGQVHPTHSFPMIDQIRAKWGVGDGPRLYAAVDGRMVPVTVAGQLTLGVEGGVGGLVLRATVPPPASPVMPLRVFGVGIPSGSRTYSQVDSRTSLVLPAEALTTRVSVYVDGLRMLEGADYEIRDGAVALLPGLGDMTASTHVIQVDYFKVP